MLERYEQRGTRRLSADVEAQMSRFEIWDVYLAIGFIISALLLIDWVRSGGMTA